MNKRTTSIKEILASFLLVGLFLPMPTMAFCDFFFPDTRVFEMAGEMKSLVYYKDGIETIVVKPIFKTNAKDFSFVIVLPNRPVIKEAPNRIFTDLENLTNPLLPIALTANDDNTEEPENSVDIEVIEELVIGDFDAVILRGNDTDKITDWLQANNYTIKEDAEDNFKYYVEQGNRYFVALKINAESLFADAEITEENMEEQATESDLILPPQVGQLSSIAFSFATDVPVSPTRILKGQSDENIKLTMYTIGEQALYTPGVDTLYAEKLRGDMFPQIDYLVAPASRDQLWHDYFEIDNMYLLRQEISFDPNTIEDDYELNIYQGELRILPTDGRFVLSSRVVPEDSGILPSKSPIYTRIRVKNYINLLDSPRTITFGQKGVAVKDLQEFLNDKMQAGLIADGIFGIKTKTAVVNFQKEYGLVADGLTGKKTKAFIKTLIK